MGAYINQRHPCRHGVVGGVHASAMVLHNSRNKQQLNTAQQIDSLFRCMQYSYGDLAHIA